MSYHLLYLLLLSLVDHLFLDNRILNNLILVTSPVIQLVIKLMTWKDVSLDYGLVQFEFITNLLVLYQAGKTVVTTIHQPSSRLFHKFDKLILLGKGSLLYFGKASAAMDYFQFIGCAPLIAMNPAEFLLDLANGNVNDISVPSELKDIVQVGNAEAETCNGKPSASVVQEVNPHY